MSLSVITDITNYQLSKNPVVAQFETNSYQTDEGWKEAIILGVSNTHGANAVGGTVKFIWKTDSVIFTIAETPDDSGNQVHKKAALSDADYAALLISDFKKNYKFSEKYTIEAYYIAGNILITAKEVGDEYILLDNSSSTNFGYGISTYDGNPGRDAAYAENYKMRADLWMQTAFGSTAYEKKGTIELDPLSNRCIFDFKDLINANLSYDLPSYAQNTFTFCNNVLKKFYLRYLEKYGNPVQERQINTSSTGYVLKAGIPSEEFYGTTGLIESRYRTPGKFLTRQPRTKKIRAAQQEYLYFIVNQYNYGAGGDIKLYITISKKDNTADVTLEKNISAAADYQVICFPVGFTALNLAASVPWENVKKYTVKVRTATSGTVVSEVFTFIPEQDFFPDEHYLYFSNSDGGIDTVRLKGIHETGFEIEKETIRKTRLFNTAVVSGEFEEIAHQKTDKYKISTGWITRAEADWLEDLFLAEKKFIDRDGAFIPIVIISSVFKKYDTNTTLYSYDIEYSTSFKNRTPHT